MRLIIEQVHLKNFRIHDDYIFSPSTTGVTAIIGDNGHGKSSIIDGIAWALYGTKPNGSMKNSALRKIGSDDASPCFVDVILGIDGDQKLRVKRSIKGKNTVQCECWINDTLEAGPSVSHADKWIPSMLGIDEEGFLSAVLVQQKQVGAIVSESASVRQQNIEKLTGITAATNAVKNAREESNSLKKAIQLIAPEASAIDETKKAIDAQEHDLNDVQASRATLKDKLTRVSNEYKETRTLLDSSSASYDERTSLSHDYDLAKQHLKDMDNRRNDMADKINEMKGRLPSVTDYEPLQKEYNDISAKLRNLQAEDKVLSDIIGHDVNDDDIAAAKNQVDHVVIPDMDEKTSVARLDTLKTNVSASKQRIKQYRKSIQGLSSDDMNDNVVCPTCLQPIEDITHVRTEFDNMISSANDDIETMSGEIDKLTSDLAAYHDAIASSKDFTQALSSLLDRRNKAEEARKKKDMISPDIQSLSREVKSVAGNISDIKANRMIIDTYNSYKKDYELANTQYDASSAKADAIMKRLNGLTAPTEKALEKLRRKTDYLQESVNDITNKAITLKGESQLIAERLDNAKKALAKAVQQERERKRIMHKYSVSQASLGVLSAFREHLAKEAVPQITDYASDMISSITDGKFISVMMDEKYSIYVKRNDGNVLDVKMLSGGERDTVAICLRLAISMMLSGGDPSMIILDEVLTAMDDSRASSILNAIQDSGHGQVIIIAHNDIIKQISDKAVLL